MSDGKPRRGRPVGSGIDDRSRLESVAALIAANPDLKPTTAIKSIGVNDPSVIRRLRDKFNLLRTELMADLARPAISTPTSPPAAQHAPAASAPRAKPASRSSGAPRSRSAALKAASPRKTETVEVPPSLPPSATEMVDSVPATAPFPPCLPGMDAVTMGVDPARLLMTLCSLGLRTASAAFGAQLALLEQATRLPHVSIALRQQLTFGELAMALYAPAARPGHTVH